MSTLLVRAEATSQIGAGHVMRCLALAQAWQDQGGPAVFAMAHPPPAVRERLLRENMQVRQLAGDPLDAQAIIACARESGAAWVVVDGYIFDSRYQRELKSAGLRLLFVDDYGHCNEYSADLVLNQNLHASESFYARRSPDTELLLGTRFAMLRREYAAYLGYSRTVAQRVRNVLVTLGGADPQNLTPTVIETVLRIDSSVSIRMIAGPANIHQDTLRQVVARHSRQVELVSPTDHMAELMQWADATISAAGATCWELLFMQMPFVALAIADNQVPNARMLSDQGLAVGVAVPDAEQKVEQAIRHLLQDSESRCRFAARGREIVDGGGAERVLAAMKARTAPRARTH